MIRRLLAVSISLACCFNAAAETLLIRNARVHTVDTAGTLEASDVLVRDGKIAAIGKALVATDARVVEGNGRPLTPGLFAGMTALGLEEVSAEVSTVDNSYTPGATVPANDITMRPEFDVGYAYNPDSQVIPVQTAEGISYSVLAPSTGPGGTVINGQGGMITLDGSIDFVPSTRTLFLSFGSGASPLTGNSRAAQYMLLEQAVRETRGALFEGERLLSLAGRETLARYIAGGRVVLYVDRAIDIRRAVAFVRKQGMKPVIAGGVEAWKVADLLARDKVPVLIDPLVNLPGNFDQIGATLDNAARLHKAGVTVAFSQSGDASHTARKLRFAAGNAVANGLPWEAGLAAITANPAAIFGATDRGRIAVGLRADLVLWDGDPLEVSSLPDAMWIGGEAQSMQSRQTLLRDRYAPKR